MKAMRVGKDSPAPCWDGDKEYEGREPPDGSSGRIIWGNDMISYSQLLAPIGPDGRDYSQAKAVEIKASRKPAM